MTYRSRDRYSTTDLARTVAYGSLAAWLVGTLIDWFDRREAAKHRRARFERARQPAPTPSRMWWDEGTLPPGVTPPRLEPPPRRSLMWWEDESYRRGR